MEKDVSARIWYLHGPKFIGFQEERVRHLPLRKRGITQLKQIGIQAKGNQNMPLSPKEQGGSRRLINEQLRRIYTLSKSPQITNIFVKKRS